MKYYIIAGEASGDLHGSNLIRALRQKDKAAKIRCWGGDKMESAGGHLVKHIRDLAFMGFAEVIKNLPAILKNFSLCKNDITSFDPDAVILIDYPGFNLRMAKWAHMAGYKTVYYISPQIWAWKEGRIHAIKKYVDKMLVIFPFEKDFYKERNYHVEYVGHPLVPVIEQFKASHAVKRNPRVIALLPGSRKQEISKKLPVMLEAAALFPGFQFFVAKAPAIDNQFYESYLLTRPQVQLRDDAYPLLMEASAALVTSGTATLETALFDVPEVVCYKTSRISYEIGRRLIKLKFICIVNLIMNREVVKELIQYDLTPKNIQKQLAILVNDNAKRTRVMEDYKSLKDKLFTGEDASERAAAAILNLLSSASKKQN